MKRDNDLMVAMLMLGILTLCARALVAQTVPAASQSGSDVAPREKQQTVDKPASRVDVVLKPKSAVAADDPLGKIQISVQADTVQDIALGGIRATVTLDNKSEKVLTVRNPVDGLGVLLLNAEGRPVQLPAWQPRGLVHSSVFPTPFRLPFKLTGVTLNSRPLSTREVLASSTHLPKAGHLVISLELDKIVVDSQVTKTPPDNAVPPAEPALPRTIRIPEDDYQLEVAVSIMGNMDIKTYRRLESKPIKVTLTAAVPQTAEEFEKWIGAKVEKSGRSKEKPLEAEQALMQRLQANLSVTDASVLSVVRAWGFYETVVWMQAHRNIQGTHEFYPETKRTIDIILPQLYGRAGLVAQLHEIKANYLGVEGNQVGEVQEYEVIRPLLAAIQLDVDRRKAVNTLRLAAILERQDPARAESLYNELLKYPWWGMHDPELVSDFFQIHISAAKGLIGLHLHDVKALKNLYFDDATTNVVEPDLKDAIRRAEQEQATQKMIQERKQKSQDKATASPPQAEPPSATATHVRN